MSEQTKHAVDIEALVQRFLGWRLPKDFAPDCHIQFDLEQAQKMCDATNGNAWPIGTNLFTSTQAREMFKFLLPDE